LYGKVTSTTVWKHSFTTPQPLKDLVFSLKLHETRHSHALQFVCVAVGLTFVYNLLEGFRDLKLSYSVTNLYSLTRITAISPEASEVKTTVAAEREHLNAEKYRRTVSKALKKCC
jgi:hypothetical protein